MSRSVADLLAEYRSGRRHPSDVAAEIGERRRVWGAGDPVWITAVPDDALRARARELDAGDRSLPLYGVPFAVKDNIDVAGLPTTAGCPALNAPAAGTAPVVRRLLEAGAMLVGKTNLDQFATGLVGTRSPYGACASVFDATRVSGGSSSGSAVAVARGDVAFALGTDTAGSGRVPAAFNGLVGLKPTRGLISTRGVTPACASLDCVSVFTTTVADAAAVLDIAAGPQADDPWSRPYVTPDAPRHGRLAVPMAGQVSFEEVHARQAWEGTLSAASGRFALVEVDVGPLLAAAPLLYEAWVAERAVGLAKLVADRPPGLDPIVAAIVAEGTSQLATTVFSAAHEVAALRVQARDIWAGADALLLPTTPFHPTLRAVAADPVGVNDRLGRYTNFANLMDLSAIALPGQDRTDGLPFGVTLLAPAWHDYRLLQLAAYWRGEAGVRAAEPGALRLAVVGAHMSGLPLNERLTSRGARLVRATTTAPEYLLYALPDSGVPRPGLIRSGTGGAAIVTEVWELSAATLGALLAEVPAPLSIGRVTLADGEEVAGFLCEPAAVDRASEITHLGGWRAYLAER